MLLWQALTFAIIRRVSRFPLVVSLLHGYLYPTLAIGQELTREENEVIRCSPETVLHPARRG
jgi:zeaxanthin glucosyltransferase